ncbi:hypothetical protein [Massilia yuzhufengensis]|uniref:hypothetical protein n=1 Tax=Massilia yuzhufengensis TaxID=1164594 RepID=UPI0011605FA6
MSSGQSYGSCRLVTALSNRGLQIGRFKVRRPMQQASLKPVWKRKFVHTTDSRHALPVAPNVLARQSNSRHVASCRRSWNVSPWTPASVNAMRNRRETSAVV